MKQRHPNCKKSDCGVCLEDCMALFHRLEKEIELSYPEDYLGWYRRWWDSRGISSETDHGWPKPFVFHEENIMRFVREVTDDEGSCSQRECCGDCLECYRK